MAGRKKSVPAKTPEGRMNQLINLAVDSAEERLRNGTASSQIITLLLSLATTKAQLELEKLKADVEVQNAKVKQIENAEDTKELFEKALEAMRDYRGGHSSEEGDWNDEYY